MSTKLLISNCGDQTLQFITDGDIALPAVISTGLTEVPQFTGQTALCLTIVVTDCIQEQVQANSIGTYNGQNVYYFLPQACYIGNGFYIVWSTLAGQWQVWPNFDPITGPSCDIVGCCAANEPLFYFTNTLAQPAPTTTDQVGVEWVDNTLLPCFSQLTSIGASFFCPGVEIITDFVDCWVIEEFLPGSPIVAAQVALLPNYTLYTDCEDCLAQAAVIATNCFDQTVLYFEVGMVFEEGQVASLNITYSGINCWTIRSGRTVNVLTPAVTITETFINCALCNLPQQYILATNCVSGATTYVTTEDDFEVGVTINLGLPVEGGDCWTLSIVTLMIPPQTTVVTVGDNYASCAQCNPYPIDCEIISTYKLTDCLGRGNDVYTNDSSLFEHIGSIIRSNYYDKCFVVTAAAQYPNVDYVLNVEVDGVFDTCFECLPKDIIDPWVNVACCDNETIEEVMCNYAEGTYRAIIAKRYGIKTNENSDINNNEIRFESLKNSLKCTPYPPLPEPRVRKECLKAEKPPCAPIQNNCGGCNETESNQPNIIQVAQDNPCQPCEPCVEEVAPIIICEACADSPHPCHEYQIRIRLNQFALASENDNTALDGKIFFGYFPCGETEVVTEVFTEDSQEAQAGTGNEESQEGQQPTTGIITREYCVLGIPILGYYANNEFVEIIIERGEECEAEEEEIQCCN